MPILIVMRRFTLPTLLNQTRRSFWAVFGAGCLVMSSSWAEMTANTGSRASNPAADAECWVADFREMALTTHNVQARESQALAWLKARAPNCSEEQLLMIATNRPSWLGHADTARVAAHIDRELEKRYVLSRRDMSGLFDSEPTRENAVEVIGTPAAPAPVVPAQGANGVPAAVVVQPPPVETSN
jgi:hypothetical protein